MQNFMYLFFICRNTNINISIQRLLEVTMKEASRNKTIKTIPSGVWESSRPNKNKNKNDKFQPSTDMQGNGYPLNNKKDK